MRTGSLVLLSASGFIYRFFQRISLNTRLAGHLTPAMSPMWASRRDNLHTSPHLELPTRLPQESGAEGEYYSNGNTYCHFSQRHTDADTNTESYQYAPLDAHVLSCWLLLHPVVTSVATTASRGPPLPIPSIVDDRRGGI
jgi:hypothetical protein